MTTGGDGDAAPGSAFDPGSRPTPTILGVLVAAGRAGGGGGGVPVPMSDADTAAAFPPTRPPLPLAGMPGADGAGGSGTRSVSPPGTGRAASPRPTSMGSARGAVPGRSSPLARPMRPASMRSAFPSVASDAEAGLALGPAAVPVGGGSVMGGGSEGIGGGGDSARQGTVASELPPSGSASASGSEYEDATAAP